MMPNMKMPFLIFAAMTASCGNDDAERAKIDAQVTETRMDDIDQIEGTINDDMINVAESTDQAPLAKDEKNSKSSDDGDKDKTEE